MKNNLLRESNDIRRLMGLPLIMEQEDNICASQDWYIDIEREGGANKLFVDKICDGGVPPAIDGEDEKKVFISSVNDLPKEAKKWIIDQIESVYPDNHETTGLGDSLTLVSIGDEMIGGKFGDRAETDMNEYYEFGDESVEDDMSAFEDASKDIKSHYNEPSFDEMKRKHSLGYDTDFDIDLTMLNEDYEIQRIRSLHENTKNRNGKLILERNYRLGSRGSQVKKIQQKLLDLDYELGTSGPNDDGVDGKYGGKTYKAVKDFQSKNGLSIDGVVGPNTSAALFGTGNVRDDDRRDDDNGQQPTPTGPVGPDTAPRGCPKTQRWYDNVKKYGLDKSVRVGMGTNKKTICKCMSNTLPGCSGDSPVTDQPDPEVKSNIEISDTINPGFKNQIDFGNLNKRGNTQKICTPNDNECGQFVNDFSDKFDSVGNAWLAYRNDTKLGPTISSKFKGLDKSQQDKAIKLWQQIHKAGGAKKGSNITKGDVKSFIKGLVGSGLNPELQLDDVVGIYWNGSEHHEEAFYHGGKAWFVDGKPGNTIRKGNGWGMNTHVGIVGAIKDGVPLIFHNVGGNVQSDPAKNLPIAWVKRK